MEHPALSVYKRYLGDIPCCLFMWSDTGFCYVAPFHELVIQPHLRVAQLCFPWVPRVLPLEIPPSLKARYSGNPFIWPLCRRALPSSLLPCSLVMGVRHPLPTFGCGPPLVASCPRAPLEGFDSPSHCGLDAISQTSTCQRCCFGPSILVARCTNGRPAFTIAQIIRKNSSAGFEASNYADFLSKRYSWEAPDFRLKLWHRRLVANSLANSAKEHEEEK